MQKSSRDFHHALKKINKSGYEITTTIIKEEGSRSRNGRTINTGAADHFLLAAQKKAELDFLSLSLFLTSRNSKGCFSLKPLFLAALKCHSLETWALSSGIHLTYMHIIKWESNINKKGISDHKRRKKGGGEKGREST